MRKYKAGAHDFEFDLDINNHNYFISVDCRGYYDSGTIYGAPEDCFPPEQDFEITSMVISDENGQVCNPNYFSEAEKAKIYDICADKFFENLLGE